VPGSGGAVLSGNALSLSYCNNARSILSTQYNHPGQIVLAFNSCIEHSRYWTSLFWRPLRATNYETGASEPASSAYSHRRSIEDPCIDGSLKAHRSPIENPSRWRFLPGRRWFITRPHNSRWLAAARRGSRWLVARRGWRWLVEGC